MTQVKKISASDVNSSITFSPVVNLVKINNSGAGACYINLNNEANTNHFKLNPQDEIEIGLNSITTVQAICDSGKTTILNIIGEKIW